MYPDEKKLSSLPLLFCSTSPKTYAGLLCLQVSLSTNHNCQIWLIALKEKKVYLVAPLRIWFDFKQHILCWFEINISQKLFLGWRIFWGAGWRNKKTSFLGVFFFFCLCFFLFFITSKSGMIIDYVFHCPYTSIWIKLLYWQINNFYHSLNNL